MEALTIPEHRDSVFGVKTKTNLASILYQLNDDKATELYRDALKEAARFNQVEYMNRLKILHILHREFSEIALDKELDKLLQLNCLVYLVSEEISHIFENRGELKLALKYMEFAYKTRLQPNIIGGEQP
ncbi:hypothetical protein [Shouchella clausii]|uniref:Uncharacterized protein n=1 Tax=Shouchella clausii TaxID=79880 RepID=A0A268S4Z1_SHOCL|nr:hypothetical protein [Shouchella clausii]PAD43662.1 hypothetical protein CHH54_05860 [Bacillus sp. 7520-S]AST98153.1 hypothetical protein BC8716_20280 [Shouchella clausii]MBU8595300.1 hypothetical protein [Shouchella clausii]MCR1286949.1 hypothetical protein [Shouchella clausii]MCY1103358.1 hypothetical protein [Shouchella clausii]